MDVGNVVVMNVHNGGHWVLATGYSGNTIYVNDPGYSTTAYDLSQIVNGQNVIYSVLGASGDAVGEDEEIMVGVTE